MYQFCLADPGGYFQVGPSTLQGDGLYVAPLYVIRQMDREVLGGSYTFTVVVCKNYQV